MEGSPNEETMDQYFAAPVDYIKLEFRDRDHQTTFAVMKSLLVKYPSFWTVLLYKSSDLCSENIESAILMQVSFEPSE
jgi:hypothetical protein